MRNIVKQANELLRNVKKANRLDSMSDSEAYNYRLKQLEDKILAEGSNRGPTAEELQDLTDPRSTKAIKRNKPKMSIGNAALLAGSAIAPPPLGTILAAKMIEHQKRKK